jgi:IS5 family transposase
MYKHTPPLEMQHMMPRDQLLSLMALLALVAKTGRPPVELAMMPRIRCLQQLFIPSNLGAECALFEASYLPDFLGIGGIQRIPNQISILGIRNLHKAHDLISKNREDISIQLATHGLMPNTSELVAATLIEAPSSTKKKDGARDSEVHQNKMGNQCHMTIGHSRGWGMQPHIDVDADTGLAHTFIGAAANVGDDTQVHALLHGQEKVVFAYSGYQVAHEHDQATAMDWRITKRPSRRKQQCHRPWGALPRQAQNLNVSRRAKIAYLLRILKRDCGNYKACFCCQTNNRAQLRTMFALSNN